MDTIQNEMAALFPAAASGDATTTTDQGTTPAGTTPADNTTVVDPATTDPVKTATDNTAKDGTTPTPTAPADGETVDPQAKPGTKPEEKTTTFEPEAKFNKQNQAFAQMRVQTKEYESIIMDLAKLTGTNVNNIDEAKQLLLKATQEAQAKAQKVDPAILAELSEKDRALKEMQAQQLRTEAITGFAKIKTLHGLSDAELGTFADALLEQKKNPFEQKLDLVSEYRLMNFDALIQKASDAAAKAAVERYKKGQDAGSNPGTVQGQNPTGNSRKEIKTTADLDAFFKSIQK